MQEIVLDNHGQMVNASVNRETREVTFSGTPVTGKMWMVLPGSQFIEIFEREGKYFLEPAA